MIDNGNFVHKMESRLHDWKAEILKFRVIAELADLDTQIEYYQIIEDIVKKEEAVKEKFADYNESESGDRSSLKNEIDILRQRVEDAIESARIRIN
jgi:hypothetical protein